MLLIRFQIQDSPEVGLTTVGTVGRVDRSNAMREVRHLLNEVVDEVRRVEYPLRLYRSDRVLDVDGDELGRELDPVAEASQLPELGLDSGQGRVSLHRKPGGRLGAQLL